MRINKMMLELHEQAKRGYPTEFPLGEDMRKIDPFDPFKPSQDERPTPVRVNPPWEDVSREKQDGVVALLERRIRDTAELINQGIGPQTSLREEIAALVAARDVLWKSR